MSKNGFEMNTKRFLVITFIFLFSITLYSQKGYENEVFSNIYHTANLAVQSVLDSAISVSTSGKNVKKTFSYNDLGKVSLELQEQVVEGNLVSDSRTNYFYDTEGNNIQVEKENWIVNQWFKTSKTVSVFDTDGNEISQIIKLWGGADWENNYRNNILYDSEGNFVEYLIESWSKSKSAWELRNKITVQTDSSGNRIELYEVIDGGFLFYNEYKYTVTNNSYNEEIYRLQEVLTNNIWVKTSADSTSYNSDGKISNILSKIWNGTDWILSARDSYNYSGSEMLSFTSESWDGTKWIPGNSSLTFRDDADNSSTMSGSVINLYFKTITDVHQENELFNGYQLSQNYPNPFNPATTIKYSISSKVKSETAKVNLVIYDSIGQEVKTLVNENQNLGTYEVTFDASSLPSGIYYYSLLTGNFSVTKKMILLK